MKHASYLIITVTYGEQNSHLKKKKYRTPNAEISAHSEYNT